MPSSAMHADTTVPNAKLLYPCEVEELRCLTERSAEIAVVVEGIRENVRLRRCSSREPTADR
jgi:hypothetical protein